MDQILNASNSNAVEAVTDEELVQAVLAGDEAAFAWLFERYKRLVVHLVGRFFNQRELVEEFSQVVFTKAYFSLKNFRGGQEKSFTSWISRVTVNVCYDELRRRQRRPEDLFAELGTAESEYIENVAANGSFESENDLVNRDLAEKLLAGLDAKDRLAVTLFHGEEMSIKEVASAVGWSESNVKVRLMRTRSYLRSLIERLG
ncbi:MAG: RNA polymerase sigma factor [Acidobacteria bacterium]|nr:RNA polymerase sigma factor [Acidobacteriota bacterium]